MVSEFQAGLACSFVALAAASSACARPRELPEPAIPTVVSIPVAPLGTAATQSPATSAVAPEALPAAPPSPGVSLAPPPPAAEPVARSSRRSRSSSWQTSSRTAGRTWSPRKRPSDPHASRAKRSHGGRPYHPGPGIVVDTTEDQGGPGTADLQRVARSAGYWPFRRCYEEGLRRDPGLAGKVSLDVAVAVNGLVERAEVVSATLRDESVALCIGREAAHLAFAQRESPTQVRRSTSRFPRATSRSRCRAPLPTQTSCGRRCAPRGPPSSGAMPPSSRSARVSGVEWSCVSARARAERSWKSPRKASRASRTSTSPGACSACIEARGYLRPASVRPVRPRSGTRSIFEAR